VSIPAAGPGGAGRPGDVLARHLHVEVPGEGGVEGREQRVLRRAQERLLGGFVQVHLRVAGLLVAGRARAPEAAGGAPARGRAQVPSGLGQVRLVAAGVRAALDGLRKLAHGQPLAPEGASLLEEARGGGLHVRRVLVVPTALLPPPGRVGVSAGQVLEVRLGDPRDLGGQEFGAGGP
jgi:hypothetical protein